MAGAEVLDLEPQDKVAAVVVIPPDEAKSQPEEGTLLQYFFWAGFLIFAGVLGKNGVAKRGFSLVVMPKPKALAWFLWLRFRA